MPQSESAKAKQRERMKEWRARNHERVKAYQKEWKAKNAASVAEYQKAYQAEYRAEQDVQRKIWIRSLHKNYRMLPEQFNALWDAQDGKCAICKVELLPRGRDKRSVAVDHNHDTHTVRALLCRQCNHGIGCLKDSPEVLRAAAEYLEKHGHYEHLHIRRGA